MRKITFVFTLLFCTALNAQEYELPFPKFKIFLDCGMCDHDFLRQEMIYLDFVRNQGDADIHILVRTQVTGSGGTEFQLEYSGRKKYKNIFHRVVYSVLPTSTWSENRETMLSYLNLGLSPFWKIIYDDYWEAVEKGDTTETGKMIIPEEEVAVGEVSEPEEEGDPWNSWIFNLGVNGSLSGEETSQRSNFGGNLSAQRVTEKNKFFLVGDFNSTKSTFTFGDTEIIAQNDTKSLEISDVISITKHWSAGAFVELNSSDYENKALSIVFNPAIEYSFFPYELASSKQVTLSYRIGGLHNDYIERTIFDKDSEFLWEHKLVLNGRIQQKWGSLSGEIEFESFLHDPSLRAFNFFLGANVRLFKGFSFNVGANYGITNNQINLAGGDLTVEELLLRQQQVKSGYTFYTHLGFNYSFGSIYNAVVNPRFGF